MKSTVERSNSGQRSSRRQTLTALRQPGGGYGEGGGGGGGGAAFLDLSRGLLLTFNGPILRRPGGEGRLSKLIAVCHVAVKSVAT